MTATIEIPQDLFLKAQSQAASEGISTEALLTEALEARLKPLQQPPAWMAAFGALSHLREDNEQLKLIIDDEFGAIDDELWR
jgi:hypothetical protein